MENCAPYAQADIACAVNIAWQAIADATVDDTRWMRHWQALCEHCGDCHRDPYMCGLSKPLQQELLLSFAVRLRECHFGRGKRAGAQNVATGLRHVAQTNVLAGYPDP